MKTKAKTKQIVSQLLGHLIIIAVVLIFLYPFVYMVCTSIKPLTEIVKSGIKLFPESITWENYEKVFTKIPVVTYITNTLIVATITMTVKMVTSILAAYALAFIPNGLSNKVFYFFIITMFVPFSVIMLPNYLTLSKMGLLNTLIGVALPQMADATAIFRLRQAMRGVPKTLIEAARLDKVSHMICLRKIVLPLIKPATASMAIFLFVNSWNEYFWPLLILRGKEMQTITLAMKTFNSSEGNAGWGSSMALATISVVLPLILYLIAQKQIISTFMSSGIKE